ncbi:MAG: hypothetical protein ACRD1K_11400 [Acidimicrobiales bacterium]
MDLIASASLQVRSVPVAGTTTGHQWLSADGAEPSWRSKDRQASR